MFCIDVFRYSVRRGDNDWTQLQWEFVAVPVSDSFPFGVKTTYRKYAQDEVILIEASHEQGALGFTVRNGKSRVYPKAVPPNVPEGMTILKSLPVLGTPLSPEEFVAGSREQLEKVVKEIERQFTKHLPEVVAEWHTFRDEIAPKDDDAVRFQREKGMYVPLYDILFSGGPRDEAAIAMRHDEDRVTDVEFLPTVQWRGHGGPSQEARMPYAPVNRAPAPVAPASSDSDTDDDEECYHYIDLPVTRAASHDYFKYVDRRFVDEEDGTEYRVLGLCEMRKAGARKNSSNIVYAFKYIGTGEGAEFEYTPVREMLNSYWCRWVESGRRRAASAAPASSRPASACASSPVPAPAPSRKRAVPASAAPSVKKK